MPGWPADIPLPVDPNWKEDYTSSVIRLTRDGVDRPLASLFAHVTSSPADGAEGVDRARSATEAFLFLRLESLPETAGRFALNAQLPIPFDGCGRLEADLLCADARLVVELDGDQHLDVEEEEGKCIALRYKVDDIVCDKPPLDLIDEILDRVDITKWEDVGGFGTIEYDPATKELNVFQAWSTHRLLRQYLDDLRS